MASSLIGLAMGIMAPVSLANNIGVQDVLDAFQEGVSEQSSEITGGDTINLPTYQDGNEQGASLIVNGLRTVLDFFKLIIAPIAVLVIVVQGVRMITAGRQSEDALSKAKNFITYATEGLIVIFLADTVVEVFFGPGGEIFTNGEEGARAFGLASGRLFEGIYQLIQVIIGSIAVLMLVMAGMRYIGGSASDEQIETAKKQITWSLVGLFVIGVSEFVVKDILFPNQGRDLGINQAEQLFAQVTNFIAGTMSTLAFVALLYAGGLYLTARENEDQVSKARSIIFGAIIGIVIAAAAFAITNTLVELDTGR